MKPRLLALSVLLLHFFSGSEVMANEEGKLRSRIIHYSGNDFEKYARECKHAMSLKAESNKSVLDVCPASQISGIEIDGDEIVLPTSIALKIITEGQISKAGALISVSNAPSMRIRFQDGTCLLFHLLINPADMSIAYADSDIGRVSLPDEAQCKSFKFVPRKGMTRAEVEKVLGPDGGISAPFRCERYVSLLSPSNKAGQKVKMNFAFKPKGMTDEVYFLGKWQIPKASEDDTVMRFSSPYREFPFYD